MKIFNYAKKDQGYIALVSALIISVLLMLLSFTLSYTGFAARFSILDSSYKKRSAALAEACVNQALLDLTIDPLSAGPKTVNVNGDICQILEIGPDAGYYVIRASASYNRAQTNYIVKVNPANMAIVEFNETPN